MKEWYVECTCECGWKDYFIQDTQREASIVYGYEKLGQCSECGAERKDLVIGNTGDNPLPKCIDRKEHKKQKARMKTWGEILYGKKV